MLPVTGKPQREAPPALAIAGTLLVAVGAALIAAARRRAQPAKR
jgi:xanthosine utilization system XapX-like protein